MKNKLHQLHLKISQLKTKAPFLLIEDKILGQLVKMGALALGFVSLAGSVYSCLTYALIPYYKTQQLSEQQIAFENELQKLPLNEPEQWQQFQSQHLSFLFTALKIKTVFHSLCELYNVRMKSGQIQELQTERGLSFKPGDITITAPTDTQIFTFLQHLAQKLSGVVGLKVIKVHRSRELNQALLTQIKAGKEGDLVEAKIEFEWLIFKQ